MANMISGVEVAVGYPAVTYVTSAARDSVLHVANTELIASMIDGWKNIVFKKELVELPRRKNIKNVPVTVCNLGGRQMRQ